MTSNRFQPERGPTPEQLAAFADGELEPGTRERIEGWLALHAPEAWEVESTRRLMSVWRSNPPPEPGGDAWAGVLAHIAAAVPAPRPVPPVRRRGVWSGRSVGGFLAAAAVLGGVLLAGPFWHGPPSAPKPPGIFSPDPDDSDEPFPAVSAGEVNIISMDAQDDDAVVLGQPVMGPLRWAAPDDIRVLQAEPHPADGMRPRLEGGPVPMIVAVAGDWGP